MIIRVVGIACAAAIFFLSGCDEGTKRIGRDDVPRDNDAVLLGEGDSSVSGDETLTDEDIVPETCGNGVVDTGEVCDGNFIGCVELDPARYAAGKARCLDTCMGWDVETCEEIVADEGDDVIDTAEDTNDESINDELTDNEATDNEIADSAADADLFDSDPVIADEAVDIDEDADISDLSATDADIDMIAEDTLPDIDIDMAAGDTFPDADGVSCLDLDGDGFTPCDIPQDCCETTAQCLDPFSVHPGAEEQPNGRDDNCDGTADEGWYDCDTGLDLSTKDPMDYARAIGLCTGVIQSDITQTDGTSLPNINSNSLLSALGAVIVPVQGDSMLALSSGKAMNPPDNTSFSQNTSSAAPSDWYSANGSAYPSSPSCGGSTGTTGNANDNVMVQFKVQVPPSAKSFSFNLYFLSIEYPNYICSSYNDFFVALLDSGNNLLPGIAPDYLNPSDKNLAIDNMKNPVGVNIAPNGLFRQCTNVSGSGWAVTSCVGTNELVGTGFESHGGTGWLMTRGNVVPGETITLRFAIWDLGDHILDSMVLLDNFRWYDQNFKPGTQER